MSDCNILKKVVIHLQSIFGESGMLIYALPPVSGIGLVPGCTILCKHAKKPPKMPHTSHKLGCWDISYRNINSFFSWQFLGNFLAKLKPSLNRGNPTSLINSYLTNMCGLFVAFLYPEGDKKSVKQEGAK